MATDYTDGDIVADSFEATIATQNYVVNNLSLTTPNVMVERNDEKARLAAKKNEKDDGRTAGSCELQIAIAAANQELINETFTVPGTANSTGTDFDVLIEEETANVAAGESRTRSVNIRKLIVQPT